MEGFFPQCRISAAGTNWSNKNRVSFVLSHNLQEKTIKLSVCFIVMHNLAHYARS